MAVPHALRPPGAAPFPSRHLPPAPQDRGRHPGHRHVAVPDEPRGLLHRHPHQQGPQGVRRRPEHRCLRHRKPPGVLLRDDRHGHQPGHAAHRGLQLRRAPVRPCAPRAEAHHPGRHVRDHGRIPDGRAGAPPGRVGLHDRRGAAAPLGGRHAHRLRLLSADRIPDGYDQLLPEHRHGGPCDLPLAHASAALSAACTALPAPVLRRTYAVGRQLGRVVRHARLGPAGLGGRGLHARLAAQAFPPRGLRRIIFESA